MAPLERKGARRSPAKARNPAGRPTPAELERRKLRVLEVATDRFIEHGYAATSFTEIAKEAGVGPNTLYQHFGDKERLFRQVIFARRTNPMEEPPKLEPDDSVFSILFRAARYANDIALRDRSAGLMRLIIAESKRFPEWTKAVADKTFDRLLDNIGALLDDLLKAGLVKDIDPGRAARFFVDLILGMVPLRAYANWEVAYPTDEELTFKVNAFIRGVLEA